MKTPEGGAGAAEHRRRVLMTELGALVPAMRHRAIALDPGSGFPLEDMEALRRIGALAAPLPQPLGGLGIGTEPEAALATMEALRLLGQGSMSVGRLYEAHVNALRLVVRYGTQAQARAAAEDALAGHLFGLWVTDSADAPVSLGADGVLHGAKAPCSGAGFATRALMTAALPGDGGTVMAVVGVAPGERSDLSEWDAHGMRASVSGRVTLDGVPVRGGALGGAGDYLRQPDFSAGAWRASAVAFGGLEALVEAMIGALTARGRDADPHQRARIGQAILARETARMWVRRAALVGEASGQEAGTVANTVNLARIAVESACLDAIRIAQQALGMGAFRRGTLVELLFRDLAMYLRQPAPDEALAEGAAWFARRALPDLA